jgi:hypothetical protein
VKDDLPTGFHDALGRMVLWFGRIEYLMKVIHLRLGGSALGDAMQDAESAEQFDRRCRDLQALYDARVADPMQRVALSKVLGRLAALQQYRTDCVHCCWKAEKDGVVGIQPKLTDGKVEWRAHRTTAEKMDEIAKALAVVYAALDQLTRLTVPAPGPAAAA